MTDYKAEYDKLVELLHKACEEALLGPPADEYEKGYEDGFRHIKRRLLPPRPPKHEEVPWWQAIEGLKSGKYRRAITPIGIAVRWNEGLLYGHTTETTDYPLTDTDLGTWRAELA